MASKKGNQKVYKSSLIVAAMSFAGLLGLFIARKKLKENKIKDSDRTKALL